MASTPTSRRAWRVSLLVGRAFCDPNGCLFRPFSSRRRAARPIEKCNEPERNRKQVCRPSEVAPPSGLRADKLRGDERAVPPIPAYVRGFVFTLCGDVMPNQSYTQKEPASQPDLQPTDDFHSFRSLPRLGCLRNASLSR